MAATFLSVAFPSRPWLSRKKRFERAWSSRRVFGGVLAVLLLGLAAFSATWLIATMFLVAAGVWMAPPAWFHPACRWLAWRASLVVWSLRSFRPAWRAAGSLLIVLAVLAGWQLYTVEGAETAKEVSTVLISILLLWSILYLRVKAGKRLFVADFVSYAKVGDEDCGKAIAARLRNELGSITALYRDIDEALPTRSDKSDKAAALTVSVQDTDFKEVLGSGFTVPLFGIQLPVGAIVSALGGRSWGPRLTGSLHEEGSRLVLTAEIGGGRKEGSWRVSTADLAEEDRQLTGMPAVYKLIEQMAYRVLTSQMDIGSPRWEAVRFFTEGLRAYRRVRRTERDKTVYLRKAERAFIRARNEDNRFAQCHYDLGVVYKELGQPDSAEAAFRQTIEEDPDRFDPYLGLAYLDLERKDFHNAGIHAEKALRVRPGVAKAWNLAGLAGVWQEDKLKTAKAWDSILKCFGMATGLAWRALCREIARSGPGSPEAKAQIRLAQICTGNLAEALADRARCLNLGKREYSRSASLFRHALALQPQNPGLLLGLGQTLFQAGDWEKAKEVFFEAYGDALDPGQRPLRWAYLAATQARLRNPEGVQAAYRNFLDFAVPHEETVLTAAGLRHLLRDHSYADRLEGLSKDLDRIGSIPRIDGGRDYLRAMKQAVAFLRKLETGNLDERRLRKECRQLDKADREWARAQVSIWLARECLDDNPPKARLLLSKAESWLEENRHKRQVEKQGLQTLIARALLLEARRWGESELLIPALASAEECSQQEPASAVRRWTLSEVYSALRDFEQVSQESDTSLALGSAAHLLTNPQALTYMAEKWLRQVSDLHSPGSWKRELERGRAFLDHVREIIESQPLSPEQMVVHALLHYWLGRFSCELRECDAGISQLEIAIQMGARPVESRLILGRAYAEAGAFAKAEQAYSSAFHKSSRPVESPVKLEPDLTLELGDERHPEDLQIEILLRLALLYASTGSNLRRVTLLARFSRRKMRKMRKDDLPAFRRREYQALYHEILGRLSLLGGRADASIADLESARALWSSASNCYHLAEAWELKARRGRDKEGALARACAVCDQADRLDMPQRYHQRIEDLRKRLNGSGKPKEERAPVVPFPSAGLKDIGKGPGAN